MIPRPIPESSCPKSTLVKSMKHNSKLSIACQLRTEVRFWTQRSTQRRATWAELVIKSLWKPTSSKLLPRSTNSVSKLSAKKPNVEKN